MDFRETLIEKSDTELLKMVYEFNVWSPEMLNAVEAELNNRNILPLDIAETKQKLVEEERQKLSKGKKASIIGLIIGWITVLGFLGIIIGYNYAFGKNRSKYSQETYFKYDDVSRKNGQNLFYTALLLTSLEVLFKLIPLFYRHI